MCSSTNGIANGSATQARGKPPAEGVTPELMSLVIDWLVKRYGSRELSSMMMHSLNYGLGQIEREYSKDETAKMLRKD